MLAMTQRSGRVLVGDTGTIEAIAVLLLVPIGRPNGFLLQDC
jgi:hypothetical protein